MCQQIIFICIRNKKVKLYYYDFYPMKKFESDTSREQNLTGFKGRAYRKEGQSGLFFCCLQMSEVFYVSEELRYLLVVLDKSQ